MEKGNTCQVPSCTELLLDGHAVIIKVKGKSIKCCGLCNELFDLKLNNKIPCYTAAVNLIKRRTYWFLSYNVCDRKGAIVVSSMGSVSVNTKMITQKGFDNLNKNLKNGEQFYVVCLLQLTKEQYEAYYR